MSDDDSDTPTPEDEKKLKELALKRTEPKKNVVSSVAGSIQSAAQNFEDSKKVAHARTLNALSNEAVRHLEITKRGLVLQKELDSFDKLVETAAENVQSDLLAARKSRLNLESEIANQEAEDAVRSQSHAADFSEQKLRQAQAEAEIAKLQSQKDPVEQLEAQIDRAEKKLRDLIAEKAEATKQAGGELEEAVERNFGTSIAETHARLERLKDKLDAYLD
ncbi:MAG: hypothetical protein AAF429_03980 [Pseudomonadota bacterium]